MTIPDSDRFARIQASRACILDTALFAWLPLQLVLGWTVFRLRGDETGGRTKTTQDNRGQKKHSKLHVHQNYLLFEPSRRLLQRTEIPFEMGIAVRLVIVQEAPWRFDSMAVDTETLLRTRPEKHRHWREIAFL